MKTSLAVAIAAALSFFGPAAHAEVRVSGFGQIIAGTTLDSGDRFPSGGYTDTVDFEEESLFAIQIDADLNERVTATAQILAEGSENFKPELAWAYANVQLGKGFSTKVGRQRIPFYRYSDFLDVGYAYPWIRPPVAMYNQPWSNADGISLSHSAYVGKWFSQAQVLYGSFDGDAVNGTTRFQGKLDHLRGFSWDVEYDEWLSLRAAYVAAEVTVAGTSLDLVTNALRQFRQNALADRLDYNQDPGTFKSVGFKVDKADWLVVGEYSELDIEDSVFANIDRTDWYTTVGHRFGAVMPHFTYGRRSAGADLSVLRGIPMQSPLYFPVAASAMSQQLDETFKSVGVRWDFAANVSLKADYTRVESDVMGAAEGDLVSAGLVFTF
ncbi:porin [Cognatilysobacter bugurensis]|uniref:Porin n=1 Tax=Cognatilysobacter bugurensis TaxID=543356 RepID=A0A918W724_9GAMM|nr:porin [Lysobacter bugurensis]GHA75541.1 hypothetical protein GCM10007067_10850 [Lysobacter bugurensis]